MGRGRQEIEQLATRIDRAAEASECSLAASRRLADSLEVVASRMRAQSRALSVNSLGAYAVFTLLLGGAFFALYRDRADTLLSQRDRAEQGRAEAEARAAAAEMRLANRLGAAEAALAYFHLLREHKYAGAVAGYPQIAAKELTPTEQIVLGEGVTQARNDLAGGHLTAGRRALEQGQLGNAEVELRAALLYAVGPLSAEAHYTLGMALHRESRQHEAMRELEQALASGAEEIPTCSTTRYFLAETLERLGEARRARAEYDRFARRFAKHPLAWKAKYRAQVLARQS
jgi:tetratricopeptide (TPR) repeat protein